MIHKHSLILKGLKVINKEKKPIFFKSQEKINEMVCDAAAFAQCA